MDDLRAAFLNLNHLRKRQAHLLLCHYAHDIWEAYASQQTTFDYVDSVVGLHHSVDITLPGDALASVQSHSDHAAVAQRYQEPIVALQDDDLVFPAHIEFAYYAIYNLYQKYIQGAAIDDWLIVNQALSAEADPGRWRTLMTDALRQAQG
jgi:hypothetical protein